MHCIHYVVVTATNHKEAQESVLSTMEDWGSEDNYKSVIGSISKKDKTINNTGTGHFEEMNSEEEIFELLNEIYDNPPYNEIPSKDLLLKSIKNKEELTSSERFLLLTYYDWINETPKKIENIWLDEIYSWSLNNIGLTNISTDYNEDMYIVGLDVHG